MGGKRRREQEDIPYVLVGSDESNHGKFPEIFVAVFSKRKEDFEKGKYTKKRKKNTFERDLEERAYSFLTINNSDKSRIPSRYLPGLVLSSLLIEDVRRNTENIYLYQDGKFSSEIFNNTRDILGDYLGIEKNRIKLKSGDHYDEKYKPVNLADQIAYWIFDKGTPKWMSQNKNKRDLLEFP